MPANPDPNHVPSVCTIWTATRQSWTRSFSKAEVEEAALAVSPAKALENYIHAQGHDLQDILKGNKLTGEVSTI
jgi:hypothetical protein